MNKIIKSGKYQKPAGGWKKDRYLDPHDLCPKCHEPSLYRKGNKIKCHDCGYEFEDINEITDFYTSPRAGIRNSRKVIKSGMSYDQALDLFTSEGKPWNDYWSMQADWTAFVDSLEKDGEVDYEEACGWDNPCTPETFDEWIGRHNDDEYDENYDDGVWDEDDIYSSKKPIKSANDKKDGDYWISRVDNGWWNDEIERDIRVTRNGEKANVKDIKEFIESNFPNLTPEEYKEIFKIIEGIACSIYWNKITSSKKPIKSGYNSWEDFYRKGCKLGLNKYMDKLDKLHDKYGAFKKVPKEELSAILKSIPDNDEDVYHFTDEMFDYFDWYDIINSSKKPIKSAVDGGWEVDSSDAPKALQMWVDYVGEDNALEDLAQATGDDNLEEDVEWIARQFGVAEELEDVNSTWEKHEKLRDLIGVHDYFENLHRAMGYDELAACLAFIFRMNDFQEWDDENGIYQSKGLRNLANVHMLYS